MLLYFSNPAVCSRVCISDQFLSAIDDCIVGRGRTVTEMINIIT